MMVVVFTPNLRESVDLSKARVDELLTTLHRLVIEEQKARNPDTKEDQK